MGYEFWARRTRLMESNKMCEEAPSPQSVVTYSQELGRHFFLAKLLPGENRQTLGFIFHREVILPLLKCVSSTFSLFGLSFLSPSCSYLAPPP